MMFKILPVFIATIYALPNFNLNDFENKTFAGLAVENLYLQMSIEADRKYESLTTSIQNIIHREISALKTDMKDNTVSLKTEITAIQTKADAGRTEMNNKINPLLAIYAVAVAFLGAILSKIDWSSLFNK